MANSSGSENPYAAPIDLPANLSQDKRRSRWYSLPLVGRSVICWTLICMISAAPSFFFGYELSGGEVLGMSAGIMTFIGLYVLVDLQSFSLRFRRQRYIPATMYTIYTIRMALTVLPLGWSVDLLSGLISTEVYQMIFGEIDQSVPTPELGFSGTYILTLFQGIVLNAFLAVLAVIVYVNILIGAAVLRRWRR